MFARAAVLVAVASVVACVSYHPPKPPLEVEILDVSRSNAGTCVTVTYRITAPEGEVPVVAREVVAGPMVTDASGFVKSRLATVGNLLQTIVEEEFVWDPTAVAGDRQPTVTFRISATAGESVASDEVSLWVGDSPRFTEHHYGEIPKLDGPRSMAVADFNSDGRADVALPLDESSVAVYLAQASGLGAPVTYPIFSGAFWTNLVTGDFNEDGHVDLAAVFGPISLLLGDGAGGFSAGPISNGSVNGAAAADINRDGHLDIVGLDTYGGAVQVHLGDGAGNFTTLPGLSGLSTPTSALSVGDFDDDGIPDVATVSNNSGVDDVTVGFGRGDGTFEPKSISAGNHLFDVAAGDFDGDGRDELVAIQPFVPSTAWAVSAVEGRNLRSVGGSIAAPFAIGSGQLLSGPATLFASTSYGVQLWGASSSGVGSAAALPQGPMVISYAMGAGDVTGDGLPDLVVAFTSANNDGTTTDDLVVYERVPPSATCNPL